MDRPWAIRAVVGLTALVTMLDNTVVTAAAPAIARDLDIALPTLEWVAASYLVAFAGLLLAGGQLADGYGHRRVLRYGLAAFTAASGLAAVAGGAAALIAARAVQGAGAALIVPATLAIVASRDERERVRCVAVWTACGAVGLALGPVAGGVLSEHGHWSWIFLLNLPVGAVALACCAAIAETRRPAAVPVGVGGVARPGPAGGRAMGAALLDWGGLVTGSLALLSAAYALIAGTARGFSARPVLLAAALAMAAAVAFVRVERRAAAPLVDPRLFAARVFSGGVAVQVLWGLGVNGVYFYTAVYLQDVRGFTPSGAGLAFLPLALAVAAGAPLTPTLVTRFGAARTVAAGLALVAAGMAAVAMGGTVVTLLGALTVIGFGSALTVPLSACILGAVPEDRAGVASAVFGVAREVSGVLGIAAVGAVVAVAGHNAGFATGYTAGLLAAAALVLCGALLSLRTLPTHP